ncbi:MAG TPA: DUF4383 domain-containing protein [Aestuariivirgaceae bacterium]|nr:DUF4383 domain-containing protein [Aestuariivirgaceae bacterium]
MADTRTACIVLGVVFIVVGLLGFIPNPLVSADGLFAVNGAHNLVHLISGLALLIGALALNQARTTLWVVGIVYGLVALLGLFSGDMLLGFIHINTADRLLHIALTIVLLGAAWSLPEKAATSTA